MDGEDEQLEGYLGVIYLVLVESIVVHYSHRLWVRLDLLLSKAPTAQILSGRWYNASIHRYSVNHFGGAMKNWSA